MAVNKESRLFTKSVVRSRVILAASITLAAGLITLYSLATFSPKTKVETPAANPVKPTTPTKVAVTALGRLQPDGDVTSLNAPNANNGVRVEKLLIKEGEVIKAGQILAYLETYGRAKTALQQAVDQLQVSKAKLAQVKSGAKTGDIDAQKAAIARLESQYKGDIATQDATIARVQAEVDNAQAENDRYQQLYKQGAIAASVADSKALQLKTTQQQLTEAQASKTRTEGTYQEQLKQAQAQLKSISEVRSVDVQVAQTEVNSATTSVQQAKADLDLSYIKSPINGKILKIHAKTGEVISTSTGFAEIGKTSQMNVIAEVYQTDVQKVRVGQKANITSTAFPGTLKGTVKEIGWQVDKQSIFSLNPGSDTDRRIVEVKISIDNPADSERVSRLTNLQVDVAIQI
ncbi:MULTISPECIES: ABC exporter membrane fusion protein [Nostoc]|uniref:ABC exporter membrane fusion protein n=1 Tax=Nostoc paludosum FACHB-159 TaxID=2692908 RepID=A0ABR8KHQ1_9NOSO|nr:MULTISPECIES: ABC exporter membrane fusion protein [Nostoc]MBD2682732.1 ABC exporter membrane fusion protein [Nostoc sp. FACHB-857]MBD2739067.1 ABC exporter membrane fusion protein [Nostoc paludosum FACHB-159]